MPLKFKSKLDKVVELLLYLAHKAPGIDKYQASKFFYLADREHLAKYGRPISFEPYFALWYGPVPSHALDLLEKDQRVMKAAGIEELPFETTIGKAENGTETTFIGKPKRDPNLNLFSGSDIRVLDETIKKYKSYSFKQLMDLTHEHKAYKAAWEERKPEGAKRAEMYYEEMIEDEGRRKAFVEDLSPVSARM
ncbi:MULTISPECIES: Panacea domain-containing protein [unclassified Bradyrhizobium]|uniref:Panacea domain-containing protein n=1 Tax=unclassified Bradyrhizobium TaxID=2631580 RepID=UPI00291620A0|nr:MULTISPECIES: Panacea domain-containing protein [unclassified Bradyrhizobium]